VIIQKLDKPLGTGFSKTIVYVLFAIIVIVNLVNHKNYYFNPDYTKILRDVYTLNPFPENKVIGDFLKENTVEGDEIAVLGSEPQLFIFSGRRGVSKHFYIAFMMGDTLLFPKSKEWQNEFMDDIADKKPKYLVYYNHPLTILSHERGEKEIYRRFNEISSQFYNMVGIIDMISSTNTKYVWYQDVKGYKYQGNYNIFIFERRE
jgi:hypothetical protein